MKVCLTVLNSSNNFSFTKYGREHLGIGYISAVSQMHGYDVTVIDGYLNQYSLKQIIMRMGDCQFDVLGISIFHQIKDVIKLIYYIKEKNPSVHITVGGHYASVNYEEILNKIKMIDSVCIGEGEKTFLNLCEKIKNKHNWTSALGIAFRQGDKVVKNEMPPLIEDLGQLPFPIRDINTDVSCLSISASRGCYGQCSFCDVNAFYRIQAGQRVRVRPYDNVVDEISYLVQKYNVRNFKFVDDNFLGIEPSRKQWAINFAKEIIKRNLDIRFMIECRANDAEDNIIKVLKEAGLENVFIGVESITPRVLEIFNKGITPTQIYNAIKTIKQYKVGLTIGYILYEPEVSIEEIIANLKFLNFISYWEFAQYDQVPVSLLEPLILIKGTPIYDYYSKKGIINSSYSNVSYGSNIQYEFFDVRVSKFREYIYSNWVSIFKELYTEIVKSINLSDIAGIEQDIKGKYEEVMIEIVKIDLEMMFKIAPLFMVEEYKVDKCECIMEISKRKLDNSRNKIRAICCSNN